METFHSSPSVIDELNLGTEEEDELEIVDRKYWETKGSKDSLKLADSILQMVLELDPGFILKYNKHYIGLSKNGVSKNFISLTPRKKMAILSAKLAQTPETDELLNQSDLDLLAYDRQWNQYRIRFTEKDLTQNKQLLAKIIEKAYASYML